MFSLKRLFYTVFTILFACNLTAMATSNTASETYSFTLGEYMKIEPVTSPVLIANIVDRTGNLYMPLMTQFRVLSNSGEQKKLYLKAEVNVEGGRESAMFSQGGNVYIAFTNLLCLGSTYFLVNSRAVEIIIFLSTSSILLWA
mgnify:CR=1 FL=1